MNPTARFLTITRDDLFDLTRELMGAVAPAFLTDPAQPLRVGINGTLRSGKKIIADAGRAHLLDPDTAVMAGKEGADEYWTGTRAGQACEIRFIDMAYSGRSEYSRRMTQSLATRAQSPMDEWLDYSNEEKYAAFTGNRTAGGIDFVQNPSFHAPQMDLNLYIEAHFQDTIGYDYPRHQTAAPGIRKDFVDAVRDSKWARYVEIEVNSERLQGSDEFNAMFINLSPFCRVTEPVMGLTGRIKQMLFIPQERDVPGVPPQRALIYNRAPVSP